MAIKLRWSKGHRHAPLSLTGQKQTINLCPFAPAPRFRLQHRTADVSLFCPGSRKYRPRVPEAFCCTQVTGQPLRMLFVLLAAEWPGDAVPECREQGPQGREIYQAYASGLFVLVAFWEVRAAERLMLPTFKLSSSPLQQELGVLQFVFVLFCAQGFVTVHGWLQLHAHIGTDQAAEAALSGSVLEAVQSSSGAWVLWAVLMLAAGSTVSKFVTQMVEQHG